MLRRLKRIGAENGFILVKLIVVVVILGVLVVLSIPLYAGHGRKAKISEGLLAISDLKHGVMVYYRKMVQSLLLSAVQANGSIS